jgi:flagellar hook assembly protein FlgD
VAGDTNSNYYWMVENGEIASNQGENLVTIQWDTISNGIISVIETNINGCTGDTVYFNVEVVNSIGIKSPIHNYTINVYPNPSNADFKIASSGYNGDIRFEVFDLSGRLIQKANQRIVSIGNCPDGIYMLKVYTNNKSNELRLIKTSK